MGDSNFSFLQKHWPLLANLGETDERNVHQDPNTTLIKLRLFGETMTKPLITGDSMF
ncbi:hypothetical protein [Lentibacillus juripiscarius]|uniref:Uncharacterized protein n=1 Tax=Lentibacillus juripiscarius TaxID=257446 RepID=A0ABW5V1V5_9BACI